MSPLLLAQTTLPCHLLEMVSDVIWTATLDGRELLYANPALERVYGRPVADFYGNPNLWLEMTHPDDMALVDRSVGELLRQGQTETTYRIVRPDGGVRWLLDRKHVIYEMNLCLYWMVTGASSNLIGWLNSGWVIPTRNCWAKQYWRFTPRSATPKPPRLWRLC